MGRIIAGLARERAIVVVLLTLALFRSPLSAMLPVSGAAGALPFLWLFAVMIWGASAVVHHAEALAERLGEPFGTLILTLSVVGIEAALIVAVMLSGDGQPTLARDTMFAVLMIVLNGLVGVALLLGALRFGEQSYNLSGAGAFLSVLVPLAVFSLVLPAYTSSSFTPTFTEFQSLFFLVVTLALYLVFLFIQVSRHRGFFIEPEEPPVGPQHAHYRTWGHVVLLLATLIPIVLLSKTLSTLVQGGITAGLPSAVGGVIIATIVLAAEGRARCAPPCATACKGRSTCCWGGAVHHRDDRSRGAADRDADRPVVLGLGAAGPDHPGAVAADGGADLRDAAHERAARCGPSGAVRPMSR